MYLTAVDSTLQIKIVHTKAMNTFLLTTLKLFKYDFNSNTFVCNGVFYSVAFSHPSFVHCIVEE